MVVLPGARNYDNSKAMCRKFRSDIYVFKETVVKTMPLLDFQPKRHFWSGYKLDIPTNRFLGNDDNGTLIDFDTIKPKLVWTWGEPNGHLIEQCGSIPRLDLTIMEDNSCEGKQYTTCIIKSKFFVQLQNSAALAKDEIAEIDKEFVPLFGVKNPDDFLLKGFSNHAITRNGSTWYLKETSGNIILSLKYSDIPLGLFPWVTANGDKYQLNINACNETEFGCDDGICLPRMTRCNQRPECSEVSIIFYNFPHSNQLSFPNGM